MQILGIYSTSLRNERVNKINTKHQSWAFDSKKLFHPENNLSLLKPIEIEKPQTLIL